MSGDIDMDMIHWPTIRDPLPYIECLERLR